MANTGYKHYTTRRQYFLDPATGLIDLTNPTGVSEPNINDGNYISDEYDVTSCPLAITTYSTRIYPTNSAIPCQNANPSFFKFVDTPDVYPSVGDHWYNENPGVTKFNGGGNWFYVNSVEPNIQHRIGADGRIDAIVTNCN